METGPCLSLIQQPGGPGGRIRDPWVQCSGLSTTTRDSKQQVEDQLFITAKALHTTISNSRNWI